MPYQNRVDPWGRLHAHPSRAGMLMGNRGILHDSSQTVIRNWATTSWVCCLMHDERLPPRKIFRVEPAPSYSELFFLDEAVALAAGHRPCNYCQGPRLREFKDAWCAANRPHDSPRSVLVAEIDKQLHKERTVRNGSKVTWRTRTKDLPDGTMLTYDRDAYLLHRGRVMRWSFEGYAQASVSLPENVEVLTPSSIVGAFRKGLQVRTHPSADA